MWYKLQRTLGSCSVYDTRGNNRLRLATPRVYHTHHSFLGYYLSPNLIGGVEKTEKKKKKGLGMSKDHHDHEKNRPWVGLNHQPFG